MDEAFNLTDRYCFSPFPELLEHFSETELRTASNIGSYVFHEDCFVSFIALSLKDAERLRRIGTYIEYLAGNENEFLVNLAEIGILEGAVSRNLHPLTSHLGPKSRTLLARVLSHFDADAALWRT